jgi:hypothetical protein
VFEQRTYHKNDGSYFNLAPRFSPDGSRYVYYSNQEADTVFGWLGTQGLAKTAVIFKGEKVPRQKNFTIFVPLFLGFPIITECFCCQNCHGEKSHFRCKEREIVRTINIPGSKLFMKQRFLLMVYLCFGCAKRCACRFIFVRLQKIS